MWMNYITKHGKCSDWRYVITVLYLLQLMMVKQLHYMPDESRSCVFDNYINGCKKWSIHKLYPYINIQSLYNNENQWNQININLLSLISPFLWHRHSLLFNFTFSATTYYEGTEMLENKHLKAEWKYGHYSYIMCILNFKFINTIVYITELLLQNFKNIPIQMKICVFFRSLQFPSPHT
jgi:hypothetical protein